MKDDTKPITPTAQSAHKVLEAHAAKKGNGDFSLYLNEGNVSYQFLRKGNIIQITRHSFLNHQRGNATDRAKKNI